MSQSYDASTISDLASSNGDSRPVSLQSPAEPDQVPVRNPIYSKLFAWLVLLLASIVMMSRVLSADPAKAGNYMDQMNYYLLAKSVAFDLDLKYDLNDKERVKMSPWGPEPAGVFLRQNANGTYFYAKPVAYAIAAAPFARFFDLKGPIICNGVLWCGLLILSYLWFSRWFSLHWAALLSAAVWSLSSVTFYVFAILSTIFVMLMLALALHLVLTVPPVRPRTSDQEGTLPMASPGDGPIRILVKVFFAGLFLGLAIYERLPLGLFAVALFGYLIVLRRYRAALVLTAVAGITVAAFTITNYLQDSTFTPYSGNRIYVAKADPFSAPGDTEAWYSAATVENTWIKPHESGKSYFRNNEEVTTVSASGPAGEVAYTKHLIPMLPHLLTHFVVGRKAGLFPYMTPFLILLLFALAERRRSRAFSVWWVAGPTLAYGILLLVLIPLHYHGAGLGNRYMAFAAPAFVYCIAAPHRHKSAALMLGLMIAGAYYFPGPEFSNPESVFVRNFRIVESDRLSVLPIEPELLQRSLDCGDCYVRPDPQTIVIRLSPYDGCSTCTNLRRRTTVSYGILRTNYDHPSIDVVLNSQCHIGGEAQSGDKVTPFDIPADIPTTVTLALGDATRFSLGAGPQIYWPLEFRVTSADCKPRRGMVEYDFLPLPDSQE